MKKVTAVFLTGVLCMATLCMTACGNQGDVSQGYSASDLAEDITSIAGSENPQDNAQSNSAEASDFSIGRMEGRTYINDYFDFYCALDNNWDIASEEELMEAYYTLHASWQQSSEGIESISWDDASIKTALDKSPLDIQVLTAKGMSRTLTVMIRKTDLSSQEEYDQYLDDYVQSLTTQYTAMSGNAEVMVDTIMFKGQEETCINSAIPTGDQILYQTVMFIHKDGYCATVMAINSVGYEENQTFFDWFGAAEDAVIIEAVPEVQYEVDYLLGSVEENVYTNEALGFRFEGDASCQYASVEELQANEGKAYDKETLNKLLKWGHNVAVAKVKMPNGGFELAMYRRDAEYTPGVMVRGNEELMIQEFEDGMYSSFETYCEQVEVTRCSQESIGEVPVAGVDVKGFYPTTGEWKYMRTLFIQSDDFFGCVMMNAGSEEDLQAMTDLFVKTEAE